jgi:hypothetical protein
LLAGAETVIDIALFDCKKRERLCRFRPFKHGTPAHDRLGGILAALDAEQFQRCFVAWVAALTGPPGGLAIDGKTSRRSGRKTAVNPAIHMVSAFAARQRLVLGQIKIADKPNEIIAIPKLLAMLAIEGAIVTIDAMGCQRDIARKVVEKKADYVLALKGRQGSRTRTLSCSWPSRRPPASRTPRSAGTRRSMAIMATSRPEPPPSSTMSPGRGNGTTGPA